MTLAQSASKVGFTSALSAHFWKGRRVFLTGHTGFKGSWFSMWLSSLGAEVYGYALTPPTNPSLFEVAGVASNLAQSTIADIRTRGALEKAVREASPEIIFHFAAQPLVLDSYAAPAETYDVNVMGTVNILDVARSVESIKAIIIITTDKVYENREWEWSYREVDRFGGSDPYSNSKACCELVVDSFRRSFFSKSSKPVGIASARAGNVIGGGDWAPHRLVPDFLNAALAKTQMTVRNPHSTRPWQHVLEPLSGYMALAEALIRDPQGYSEGWNFGPTVGSIQPVGIVTQSLQAKWREPVSITIADGSNKPHEAKLLSLDCSKALSRLGWKQGWSLDDALDRVIEFARAYQRGENMRDLCLRQIESLSSVLLQKIE